MLTVRTSENTVITSFRLISERQDFSSVRTGENTVRARARIHLISAQVLGRTPFEFGVWRFIAGFAIAGLIPLVNSIISTECPPDKKGEVFGFNFLTGHAGMALGPFAAGALSGWFGYQAVIVASGLILFPLIAYLNYGEK